MLKSIEISSTDCSKKMKVELQSLDHSTPGTAEVHLEYSNLFPPPSIVLCCVVLC